MGIVGDNKFSVSAYGAVYKLVVIRVGLDKMEEVCRFYLNEVRPVDESLDYGFGQSGR